MLISRVSLHDETVSRLRALITDGALRPGSRIDERELCERFGVSRTPLREALKVLASEGLVELLPHRGSRVTRLSAPELRDAFEIVAALEALAGELACRRITDAQIDDIAAVHARMEEHYRRGEPHRVLRVQPDDPRGDQPRRRQPAAHRDVRIDLQPRAPRALHGEPFARALGERDARARTRSSTRCAGATA